MKVFIKRQSAEWRRFLQVKVYVTGYI